MLNETRSIIVQGAVVSRYCWPIREKHAACGGEFRGIYGIEDHGPLRARNFQNAIEHFDERLDEYLSRAIIGNIGPLRGCF